MHCITCNAEWPRELRKPDTQIYCPICLKEKRDRAQARIADSLPAHEARAAAFRAKWDAMTPAEQTTYANLAKAQLWPS